LIHQARYGNTRHRGSFRGLGFELGTDAYGTARADQCLLLSIYGTQPAELAGANGEDKLPRVAAKQDVSVQSEPLCVADGTRGDVVG
jgi:hypothetical protein